MRYWLVFIIMLAHTLAAQNLVPNPGFEEVDSLPCDFLPTLVWNETLNDYDAYYFEDYVKDWVAPTGGTTDLYSTLQTDSVCSANPALLGIAPRSGANIAGIFVSGEADNYREYLQVPLKQSLKPGYSYYAEMYVILGRQHSLASNNLGMYFSDTAVNAFSDFGEVLPFSPQINESEVIVDEGWHKVSGCFVADSEAKYLLIGNFFDYQHTDSIIVNVSGGFLSYYFIDDVLVEEIAPFTEHVLGNDTLLCAGETLLLNAYVEGATYQWDDGSTGPTLLARVYDTYWVDISIGNCTIRDSIRIDYEPAVDLGKDTLLCEGETMTLTATRPNGQYLWNDLSTEGVLTVTQPGTYWVQVPSAYCQIGDTIQVDFVPCPGEIPNVFTPNGDDKNEVFIVQHIANHQWALQVFNRWGRQVYQNTNYQNDWQGSDLPGGVYYYLLKSEVLHKEYKGWVQIIKDEAVQRQ